MIHKTHAPKYQQIIRHFEKRIFEGRLVPGDRIGSTVELSKEFKVNPETVQYALSKLMQRGIIVRQRGAGTFVRKGVNGRTVGIVFGENVFTDADLSFFNIFLKCFAKSLSAAGWDYKHFVTGMKPECDSAFNQLQMEIEDGKIRAVIEFCSNAMVVDWLKKSCPVPFLPTAFNIDYEDFISKGLDYLSAMGRMNTVLFCSGVESRDKTAEIELFATKIANARNGSRGSLKVLFTSTSQFSGYVETVRLIEEGYHFDSMLVLFDSTFRGVLYALLEKGIRIPEDVSVITYANRGVDIFSHIPLTKLEFNPDDFAKVTVESLKCKIEGGEYIYSPLKPTLVKGMSCGEGFKGKFKYERGGKGYDNEKNKGVFKIAN
ncbi:MAG: GntR family transcriptional regulator [Victivallales bacterium]|jgi:DNA-binding transcriptional regulator YhcF (GntR family)